MALMLKNARLIDPQIGLDEVADILIRDGKIVEVGHDLAMEKGVERPTVVSPRCAPCRTRARWSTTPWPWNT